jgi:hypothetical protein
MNKKPKDRDLDVPGEANRDKHINFVANERSEMDPSEDRSTGSLDRDLDKRAQKKKNNPKRKGTHSNNAR